ncbi:MAG: cytochrome P450 [Pseudomonadota bacterium]
MAVAFLDLADPAFSTRSEAVREARAAHWCARTPFGLAVLRHREAGLLLRDRRLRQGSHAWPRLTGLEGPFAEFWMASVIAKEGPEHKALRARVQVALHPDHIAALIPDFERIAGDLLDRGGRVIEFMSTFAIPFAGRAICALLGLPESAWRRVAQDAATLGLAMGVDAKRHEAAVNAATERLYDLARDLVARRGAFVRRLDEGGEIAEDALLNLIVMSIFGGVDTTRSQLGHGMVLFAEHPSQWQALRADPALIPRAVEEMIRAFPTTTWSTREAVERFEFAGETIEAGQTIHILVHATAMDPAVTLPQSFDITAPRRTHFGFGGGAHHCLGSQVARTDMAAALRVMAERVERISLAGTPVFLPDSGNTSPEHLPVCLETVACVGRRSL